MKTYGGVRAVTPGKTYEVNFRPIRRGERVFRRVSANSKQEASLRRAELIAEAKSTLQQPGDTARLVADFAKVWETLHSGLIADNLPAKTISRYRNTFKRLFTDFREAKFPDVTSFQRINLAFFVEYKNYYCSELGRAKGLRSELIVLKAMMQRIYRLGYCRKDIIERLKEIKKPKPKKREYPEIPKTKISDLLGFIKKDRPDFYDPLYFICRTGRRIEETTLICKSDLVWDGISPVRINIRAETTKSREVAPLTRLDADLATVIRHAHQNSVRHKAPYLFLNRQHSKFNQRRVCEYLKKASMQIISQRITPHYFRHRFMTECALTQVPVADAMAISGHKDPEVVLSYYSHSTDVGQDKVLEMTRI